MRKTVYNTSKAKVNNLENFWCFDFNSNKSIQYRQTKFEEKNGDVENTMPDINGLMSTKLLIQKPVKWEENLWC